MMNRSQYKDKPLAPFIAVCAFIILMTLILISFREINMSATGDATEIDYGKSVMVRLSPDIRERADFNFTELTASSKLSMKFREDNEAYCESLLNIRRLIALHQYDEAEDALRTLYLFFPEDAEVVRLLITVLNKQGKREDTDYFQDQLLFLDAPIEYATRTDARP